MNTCETCQHWGEFEPKRYGQNRACTHIVRGGGVPYASSVSPIHDNNFLSDFFPGPQFGCVHHAPNKGIKWP